VALESLGGGLQVASRWLRTPSVHHPYTIHTPSVHDPYTIRTPGVHHVKRLWGGLGVPLRPHWGGFAVVLGGFARLFRILYSAFRIRPRAFSISILNTVPLTRLPRGGLGAPWYHPGPSYTHRTSQRFPFQSGKLIQITFLQPFRRAAVFGFGCWMLHVGCLARAAVVSSVSIV